MVHRHDSRISVKEELCAIIEGKKVLNSVNALDEVISYFTDGFTDAGGLAATGVILKNHSDKKLNAAMDLCVVAFRVTQYARSVKSSLCDMEGKLKCMLD